MAQMKIRSHSIQLTNPRQVPSQKMLIDAGRIPQSHYTALFLILPLIITSAFAPLVLPLSESATITVWQATSTGFPEPIAGQSCVTVSTSVYCVGIYNGTSWSNDVYYAKLTSSGQGSWQVAQARYPELLYLTSCVSSNQTIYCIGGQRASSISNSVYYASVSPSSGIVAWQSSASYPTEIEDHSCVQSDNYVYCVGGYGGGSQISSSVYYAQLSSSGVGSWRSGLSYPSQIAGQSCVTDSGNIYCVGGYNGTTIVNTVYYSQLSPSGVGSWHNSTAYPFPVTGQSCVSDSGYIYCVGGYNGLNFFGSVYYAQLTAAGVGPWQKGASYPYGLYLLSCVANSGVIYCGGGDYEGSGYVSDNYYAQLSSIQSPLSATSTHSNVSGQLNSRSSFLIAMAIIATIAAVVLLSVYFVRTRKKKNRSKEIHGA